MNMLIDRIDNARGGTADVVGSTELALMARLNDSWVRRLMERGRNPDFKGRFFIPAVKVGNSWGVRRQVAEVFLQLPRPGPGKSYDRWMADFAVMLADAGLHEEAQQVRSALELDGSVDKQAVTA